MSEFQGLYDVRDLQPGDKSFVLATFLRGLYYGDSWFSEIPKDIFMNNYKVIAENLIKNPNVVVKVACLKEDPNIILGYSILSSDYQTITWVYVKSAWRLKGIGRSLLPKYPTHVTHLSKLGKTLMSKYDNLTFNPFKLY